MINRKLIIAVFAVLTFFAPVFSQTQFHEVKKGETLYAISRIYGITVDELKKAIDNNTVAIQQLIK